MFRVSQAVYHAICWKHGIFGYGEKKCQRKSYSALNHVTANAQDIQPVQFKLKTLQTIPRSEHITSWGEEKRTHRKHPSGPNPVGNHLPPTKP
ncbi:hypothetical protein Ahy_B03g068398 isoform A [Arachis hypogaea]|uniref:Uncharacterized protein n=1 Tax=Arachis hypogaea TaxID=3818 RepID=A0A445A9K1_ARAHY|nr:hypothetical protein Ahy_B03g068398 isoform A [Arachis hypogaea]